MKNEPEVIQIPDDSDDDCCQVSAENSIEFIPQGEHSPHCATVPRSVQRPMTGTQASSPGDVVDCIYKTMHQEQSFYTSFVYAHFVILTSKGKETKERIHLYSQKTTNISRLSFPEKCNGSMYMTRKVHCKVERHATGNKYVLVNCHKASGVVVDGKQIKIIGEMAELRQGSSVIFGGREGISTRFKISKYTSQMPSVSPSKSPACSMQRHRHEISSYFSKSPARSSKSETKSVSRNSTGSMTGSGTSPSLPTAEGSAPQSPTEPSTEHHLHAAESTVEQERRACSGTDVQPTVSDCTQGARHALCEIKNANPAPDRTSGAHRKATATGQPAQRQLPQRQRKTVITFKAEPATVDNHRKRSLLSRSPKSSSQEGMNHTANLADMHGGRPLSPPSSAHARSNGASSGNYDAPSPEKRLRLTATSVESSGSVLPDIDVAVSKKNAIRSAAGRVRPAQIVQLATDLTHCADAITSKPSIIKALSGYVDGIIDDAVDDTDKFSDTGVGAVLPSMSPTAVPTGASLLRLLNKMLLAPVSEADAAHVAFISRTMTLWVTATRKPLLEKLPSFVAGVLGHEERDWVVFSTVLSFAFRKPVVATDDAAPKDYRKSLAVSVLADVCEVLDTLCEWLQEARLQSRDEADADSGQPKVTPSMESPLQTIFKANGDGTMRSMRIVIDAVLPSFGKDNGLDYQTTRDAIAAMLLRHMFDGFPSHRHELLSWVSVHYDGFRAEQRLRFLDALQGDELRAHVLLRVLQQSYGLPHSITVCDHGKVIAHGMERLKKLYLPADQVVANTLEKVLVENTKLAYKSVLSGAISRFLLPSQLDQYCKVLTKPKRSEDPLQFCRRQQLCFFLSSLAV
eukprot:m.279543 g.279543  ORF g.279543 m.279543 type:complete len:856 (+) comp19806_c0_seq3:211-2778(+)